MKNGKLFVGSIVLAAVALLASSVSAQVKLGEGRWQLVELNGKRLSNSKIYVEFDESRSRISGHSGCNRFFAGYELDGRDLKVDAVGSTKMACMRPGVMETEGEFLKSLADATRLSRSGANLSIFQGDSRTLRFRRSNASVSEPNGLGATTWTLKSIKGVPVTLTKDVPTLNFDLDKKSAGGNSGCNSFGGSFEVNGSSIKFGRMIMTMRACEFEDRMNVEKKFMEGLENADRFELTKDSLTLLKDGEALLVFARSGV